MDHKTFTKLALAGITGSRLVVMAANSSNMFNSNSAMTMSVDANDVSTPVRP